MDRLQTMATFVAVAEETGFAPAARRLGMSPPSVTRAVSELESRLGARLFHRTTRQVRLTQTGERYLADCRRILQELAEADATASGEHSALRGTVHVTASALFGRLFVAPHLLDFLTLHRDVAIKTFFVDRVVDLIDEGQDVAVRIAELPDSSLSAVRVGQVRRIYCASPDYLQARGVPKTPDELRDHDTVAFPAQGPGFAWMFEHDGKRVAHQPQSRFRANNAEVAVAAALKGYGITRVLSYQAAVHLESGALKLVLQDFMTPPVPVHVVHKETGNASARIRAMFDFLVEKLKGERVLHTFPS